MTNEPKRSRRTLSGILRPKFSLRTLLVAMFVAALASAWWSQRGRVQQEVCRELTKRGISWELVKETPWYWRWLPERVLKLGDGHWFRHLAIVSYAPNAKQNDDTVWIARLPQVDHLHLAWHGDPSAIETVRTQLAPLSQARGIDKIHLNEFSMAMNDPPCRSRRRCSTLFLRCRTLSDWRSRAQSYRSTARDRYTAFRTWLGSIYPTSPWTLPAFDTSGN